MLVSVSIEKESAQNVGEHQYKKLERNFLGLCQSVSGQKT